jgi:hypothetical protein
MRITEEPFVTRESILAVLKPSGAVSERPFRTLRQHDTASEGLLVLMRSPAGQILGQVRLYSSLNGDAARAYRLRRFDEAKAFAKRAAKLERSPWAKTLRDSVARLAASLPLDPLGPEAPPALRRYVKLRRRSCRLGLDSGVLEREWLTHSSAWLDVAGEDYEVLAEAIEAIAREADKARAAILDSETWMVSTFYGVVRRMDATAAELEGENEETILVPRGDLERQGLAVLDQAVSLLHEVLPGGGSYILPMPAASLRREPTEDGVSPWDTSPVEERAIVAREVSSRDSEWLDRALSREPTAIPVAPLPLG